MAIWIKTGTTKINSIYSKAFDFQQGRARVVKNRKTGIIDESGTFVMFPKQYDLVFPFDENGIAQVRENNMGPFGLINRDGVTITPCIYNKIFPFSNGYAKVVTRKGIGFVDTLGKEVIAPKFRAVGKLSEELVAVQNGFSYLWQYINMDNKLAFAGKFSTAEPFKNGVAIVSRQLRDENTNIVINKKGEPVELANEGMALHYSEKKYGFRKFNRNPEGKITSSYCIYADSLGNPIFGNMRFTEIEPFENNVGVVQLKNRKWSMLNERGFTVIPGKYNRIFRLPNQMFSAISSELFGLYANDGTVILEPVFDQIEKAKRGIFRIEQGSQIGYFTQDGIWLWQIQD